MHGHVGAVVHPPLASVGWGGCAVPAAVRQQLVRRGMLQGARWSGPHDDLEEPGGV